MNYQSLNFRDKGSWNENVKKGLQEIIFLSFVSLYVVKKSEKVGLYLLIK